jgi:hypothetical protein
LRSHANIIKLVLPAVVPLAALLRIVREAGEVQAAGARPKIRTNPPKSAQILAKMKRKRVFRADPSPLVLSKKRPGSVKRDPV